MWRVTDLYRRHHKFLIHVHATLVKLTLWHANHQVIAFHSMQALGQQGRLRAAAQLTFFGFTPSS